LGEGCAGGELSRPAPVAELLISRNDAMRMVSKVRWWGLTLVVVSWGGLGLAAQEPAPPEKASPKPPPANLVAATVNGQPVAEIAIFRSLLRTNPKNYDLARKDVLLYLVDNVLIDQ